jgi:hypothetical protein
MKLVVKSHVARDLLQSAGLFKTDKLVVWEYVSNGLQYVGAGTNPVVKVSLDSRKKRISIQDNGRGMDWKGLQNFFVMHGENLDRKEGRPGRERFVSVPTGMKQHLSGAYQLRVAEGAPIGRLVVKDSQTWGLGPLFSRRGGDPGDSLRILFDLKTKIATAELGQASAEEEDEVNQQLVK